MHTSAPHGQGLGRGFDSRIPIQLRSAKTAGMTVTDRECDGNFDGDGRPEGKVWEYDGFTGYRVVGGVPEMAVCWRFMWEPAADFPPDEVAEMKEKRQWGKLAAKESRSKKQPKGQGRPRQRLPGGTSTGS